METNKKIKTYYDFTTAFTQLNDLSSFLDQAGESNLVAVIRKHILSLEKINDDFRKLIERLDKYEGISPETVKEMRIGLEKLKIVYDNEEDLAGVVSRKLYDKAMSEIDNYYNELN